MAKRRNRQTRAAVPAETRQAPTGGYYLPVTGGFLPSAWGGAWNWWQMGYDPLQGSGSATVQACISCYAQTVAMCPGAHWRRSDADGGRKRIAGSALSRVLKFPNAYQTISDFLLNLVGTLLGDGNVYALALRNNRFEITELHLMHSSGSWPRIAPSGELFYHLSGNEVVERMFGQEPLQAVPARDVLHLRLNARTHPLKGEPPLTAAMVEVAASNALVAQALSYTNNQGRPSGVIETDETLTSEQTAELRRRWNELTQGANAGGTPILTHGLKWKPTVLNSRDAQLAELLQLSDQRVASVFRVPLPLLSLFNDQTPQTSTETLMQFWLASGLGFMLNHVEEGIGRLFGLSGYPDEYLEFDTEALQRSNFKDRIEGLARGVQGGIFAPNEARGREELRSVPYGDEPRVQQQVVPLSAWAQTPPQTPRPDAPDAPPSSPPSADGTKADAEAAARLWTKQILDAADRLDRTAA